MSCARPLTARGRMPLVRSRHREGFVFGRLPSDRLLVPPPAMPHVTASGGHGMQPLAFPVTVTLAHLAGHGPEAGD